MKLAGEPHTRDEMIQRYRGVSARLWNPPAAEQRHIAELERRNAALWHELVSTVKAKELAERAAQTFFFALATRACQQPTRATPSGTRKVIAATAQYYNVPPRSIVSYDRTPGPLKARKVAMYLARVLTARSFPQLANDFNRDHTCLLHAYRGIKERIAYDEIFASEVSTIRQLVEGWVES